MERKEGWNNKAYVVFKIHGAASEQWLDSGFYLGFLAKRPEFGPNSLRIEA